MSRHVDPLKRLWAEPLCQSVPPDLRDAAPEELRRDVEEAVRIAYVAATRARDLLVLPGVGDLKPGDELVSGWLEVLNPAIYPSPDARRYRGRAPGCPMFGEDSVHERPPQCQAGTDASVAPGLHSGGQGGSSVVWWDPSVLRLDVQEEVGLRQERILVADQGDMAVTKGIEAHERWQARRAAALESGAEPSMRIETVTALAAKGFDQLGEKDRLPEVVVEEVDIDRTERPAGRRFGLLVHAMLAAVDFDGAPEAIRSLGMARGRLLGASREEVESAIARCAAALRHPLMLRAAIAARRGAARREEPVLLRLPNRSLAEGIVDLAFREEEANGPAWIVVDFKTDREIGIRQPEYERQVGLYARAISKATGEPSNPWLLIV